MADRPHVVLEALQVRENPAGTGRGIIDLCVALAARDRGLDFTVLTTTAGLFRELEGKTGWAVREIPTARRGALRKALYTQFGLPNLLRELGADLLHCLQFVAPLRPPCPLVATVHDLAWLDFPGTIEEPRRSYYRWLVPRSLAKADALVTNSEATTRETIRHFPGTAAKIFTTPHGTPRWVLERMDRPDPVTIPQSVTPPYFLFVGTREPRKNLVRLLAAYGEFLGSAAVGAAPPGSVPHLVLVGGRGWKDASVRSTLGQWADEDSVTILDYCDDDVLWGLYRGAQALVFPSLNEGFGLPILEAMAAGLPVLTSDRGGTAEVAGSDALLVNPENVAEIGKAMERLAFDGELRARLGVAGPDRARQWSWARTADLTVDVYNELLDRPEGKKALPIRG